MNFNQIYNKMIARIVLLMRARATARAQLMKPPELINFHNSTAKDILLTRFFVTLINDCFGIQCNKFSA